MKNLILTLFISSLMTLSGISADTSSEDQTETTSTFSPVWKMALELASLQKIALNDDSTIKALTDCIKKLGGNDEEMGALLSNSSTPEEISAEEDQLAAQLSAFIRNAPLLNGDFDILLRSLVDYAQKKDCSKNLLEAILNSIVYRHVMQQDLLEQDSVDYPQEELKENFHNLSVLTLELLNKFISRGMIKRPLGLRAYLCFMSAY